MGGGGGSSARANEINEEMNRLAREQFDYYKEEKEKQQIKTDATRAQFESFEFKNPFAGAKNEFRNLSTNFDNLAAGAQNVYEGMENRFEDMTVDMRAADFQAQQGQQQRANILQGLRGAAGSSGVAGLAQSMANQGALQSQQIAAGISQQERQNQMLAAQEGSRIDQMQRAGAAQVQQMQMQGAEVARQMGTSRENLIAQGQGGADRMIMQGEAAVQGAEFGRESTLLAADYGLLSGAGAALSGAEGNVMSSLASQSQMYQSQQQASNQNFSNMLQTGLTMYKIYAACIPKGTKIDAIRGSIKIEDIRPGDMIVGYDGYPVKVLHKHEYLEDPKVERWYEIEFSNGAKVNTCDMHKINGVRAKDVTENVVSKNVYSGVELSYDMLTEDSGYRINGVPVNSMIPDMGKAVEKIKKQIIWQ
jgi:hypothetical protein